MSTKLSLFWGAMLLPLGASSAELKKSTLDAFERYAQQKQTRIVQRTQPGHPFLWVDESPERRSKVQSGEIVAEPFGSGEAKAGDGLIHDWIAAMFIPGATLDGTFSVVHDYNNYVNVFKPDVIESRLISQNGNDYQTSARLLKKKVLTIVFDAKYDVRYVPLDAKRWYSSSRSSEIREVENPGTKDERQLPDGVGHGFLWRLYTFSRFEERDGGVYVECEALSLSRGLPFGLAWVIRPMIRDIPRESLSRTLSAMRDAVLEVQSVSLRMPQPVKVATPHPRQHAMAE